MPVMKFLFKDVICVHREAPPNSGFHEMCHFQKFSMNAEAAPGPTFPVMTRASLPNLLKDTSLTLETVCHFSTPTSPVMILAWSNVILL